MATKVKPEKRILNCIPSAAVENDWVLEDAVGAEALDVPKKVPKSKDLREDDWWSIGDQLDTGSCVGWATADSVLRWHFATTSRIKKSERLSVRYIWMAAKEFDPFVERATTFIEVAGTSLKTALDVARRWGVVREQVLPFQMAKLYPDKTETFYAIAAQLRVSMYINLHSPSQTPDLQQKSLVDRWRIWLSEQGPILTRLNVDATWDNISADGLLDIYQPSTVRGGHAIALVGYTPDRFIVRNSWGKGWGDGGYAYASLDYAQVAFTESYGVVI